MKNHLVLAGLLLAVGCACTDTYYCPDLSPGGRALIRLGGRDTFSFADSSGLLRYDFVVSERYFKPPYLEECRQSDFSWKCFCNDCGTYGRFKAWSTAPAGGPFYYGIYVDENPPPGVRNVDNRSLDINIMDFVTSTWYEDSAYYRGYLPAIVHLETIELNGKHFRDIFVFESDTLNTYHVGDDVWRIYFSNTKGVVGFCKRYPRALLTLQNP